MGQTSAVQCRAEHGRRATRCHACLLLQAIYCAGRLITHNTSPRNSICLHLCHNWSPHCYACLASDLMKQRQLAVNRLSTCHQSGRGPVKWPAKHQHLTNCTECMGNKTTPSPINGTPLWPCCVVYDCFLHAPRTLSTAHACLPAFQNVYIMAKYRNSPFPRPRDEYGLSVLAYQGYRRREKKSP